MKQFARATVFIVNLWLMERVKYLNWKFIFRNDRSSTSKSPECYSIIPDIPLPSYTSQLPLGEPEPFPDQVVHATNFPI